MIYLGNLPKQEIRSNGCKTLCDYTAVQKREVVLFYVTVENCFVLKQIAICSEMTEAYTTYWVFLYDYICDDIGVLKNICLSIVDKEILPHIQYCVENDLPISTGLEGTP